MQRRNGGLWAVALVAATATGAAADPPSTSLTARGSAPLVCVLGSWVKDSGPGSFSGGTNALLTYGDSDLVDAESRSVISGASAITLHASLLCNTQLIYGIASQRGTFQLVSGATAPGFASAWNYTIIGGPQNAAGKYATGYVAWDTVDVGGSPNSLSTTADGAKSLEVTRFKLVFTPTAQSARMLAGSYSETFSVSISPSI